MYKQPITLALTIIYLFFPRLLGEFEQNCDAKVSAFSDPCYNHYHVISNCVIKEVQVYSSLTMFSNI